MEIYKQREYDVRNIIDDISCLSGLFENYVEEANKFIDYLLEDTKEINTLKQELQRKDNNWNELKKYVDNLYEDETYHSIGEVLDKMVELENDN